MKINKQYLIHLLEKSGVIPKDHLISNLQFEEVNEEVVLSIETKEKSFENIFDKKEAVALREKDHRGKGIMSMIPGNIDNKTNYLHLSISGSKDFIVVFEGDPLFKDFLNMYKKLKKAKS